MTLTSAFILGLLVGVLIAYVLLSFFVVSGRSEDCLHCTHYPKEEGSGTPGGDNIKARI